MSSKADTDTAWPSSSTSVPRGEYEVFLSFRGSDTRYTFTDFLYTYLNDSGVCTFRDDRELSKGEEIGPELLKAITESSISIPIFSKNYASSKWCLREITKMVECRRTKGQLILPIFYDVEPSEVQHQSGSLKEAFRKHESCFHESTVKEWKDALREVGALKGWETKKEADGHQGKLIKVIVQTVLLELKKNYVITTDNLVGIDDHVNEMMRLLKVGFNDTRIVGIHGMGGIGKTTIAKFIYNKLLECFECCSFLADVREMAQQHKGLVCLQKQLLIDTIKLFPNIVDVNNGINIIKHKFLRKKVLIVLDDVNEKSQFNWLVGNHDWFGRGSRIIVTTRDKHVLNTIEADETYEPPFMNFQESLELLSIHAFRKKFSPIDYESISREVASTTAGLPLALEVIGSFLSDKTKSAWKDTLKKLKKIPDDQVQKKLRISYDGLNHEQQQIFLNIACLFIGMHKTYPFYMWDDCCYYPEKEINVLCLMSLVKMGNDNVLRMHDQFRDLGREIVRQEDLKNPGTRSRLWDQKEALDVFKGHTGTEKVEVLSLPYNTNRMMSQPCFTSKEFTKLSNLRYLQVDARLVGDFKHHLLRLRWLRWKYCPSHFEATDFHMKNLIILDLSDSSSITENWEGWNQIKMANKLKVLDLTNCGLRTIPDISTHANLEILNLGGCKTLHIIDSSIGNMKNLKVLNISHTRITRLPQEIWMLEKLEVIDASRCYDLEGTIPRYIGRLSSLRHLSFSHSEIQSLPTSICELSCLQTLDLDSCKKLQALPDLPSSLEILKVLSDHTRCRYMLVTPNLAKLVDLQELQFSWCKNHRCWCKNHCREILSDIEKLSKLQRLILSHSDICILPKEIGYLSRLKILSIQSCHDLQYILALPSKLVELSLGYTTSLRRLPDLSNLKILLKLTISHCNKLAVIQVWKLESLTSLEIYSCKMLEEVQGLGDLEWLRILRIQYCKLAKLDLLEHSTSLPSSKINEYKHIEEKPDRSNLNELRLLDLSGCKFLKNIQGLEGLKYLGSLILNGCTSLEGALRVPMCTNVFFGKFHPGI